MLVAIATMKICRIISRLICGCEVAVEQVFVFDDVGCLHWHGEHGYHAVDDGEVDIVAGLCIAAVRGQLAVVNHEQFGEVAVAAGGDIHLVAIQVRTRNDAKVRAVMVESSQLVPGEVRSVNIDVGIVLQLED